MYWRLWLFKVFDRKGCCFLKKRVQLIPLLVLLVCSGISVSSGFYFYEVNEIIYPIHVVLVTIIYYVAKKLLKDWNSREEIPLLVTFGVLAVCACFLHRMLKGGFASLFNQVSDQVMMSWGISLGTWRQPDIDFVGLAICQLLVWDTAISLYLYEKKCPTIITALPSFLLFWISILFNGVPYGTCVLTYALALITFFGMGRCGESIKKLVVLCSCCVLVGTISFMAFSWENVESDIIEYRKEIFSSGVGTGTGTSTKKKTNPKEQEAKKDKEQTINFGQFSREGDIAYTGTVAMYVSTDAPFRKEKLYLVGFVGTHFQGNNWYGKHLEEVEYKDLNNAFKQDGKITIKKMYDKGTYVPVSVKGTKIKKLLQIPRPIVQESMLPYLDVNSKLQKKIENEIIKGKNFSTISDAIEFLDEYFRTNYKYTLHPGKLVTGENEIEKFLFERKSGYCTHFASAAVMILRAAGFPTRLVQGYMISGNRIFLDENIPVYDSNAHAWIEVYVENKGWVPVDITPRYTEAEEGENAVESMGGNDDPTEGLTEEDLAMLEQAKKEANAEAEESGVVFEEDDNEKDEDEDDEEGDKERQSRTKRMTEKKSSLQSVDSAIMESDIEDISVFGLLITKEIQVVFWMIGILIALSAAVSLIYLLCDRICYIRIRRKMMRGNVNQRLRYLNKEFEKVWKKLGILWDNRSSEKMVNDIFVTTVKYYVFGKSEEMEELQMQIRNYVLCVYNSCYGKKEIQETEYKECEMYIASLLESAKRNSDKKCWKKLYRYPIVRIIIRKRGKVK